MAVIQWVQWRDPFVQHMADGVPVSLVWWDELVTHVMLAFMDSLLLDASVS